MQIEVINKIGDTQYKFHVDEKDPKEALLSASVFGNTPHYCHECKNTDFFALSGNKDKESNVYISIVCKKCGAKANLGSYKSGGFFWKRFEKYVKPGESSENSPKPTESKTEKEVLWDQ